MMLKNMGHWKLRGGTKRLADSQKTIGSWQTRRMDSVKLRFNKDDKYKGFPLHSKTHSTSIGWRLCSLATTREKVL